MEIRITEVLLYYTEEFQIQDFKWIYTYSKNLEIVSALVCNVLHTYVCIKSIKQKTHFSA